MYNEKENEISICEVILNEIRDHVSAVSIFIATIDLLNLCILFLI